MADGKRFWREIFQRHFLPLVSKEAECDLRYLPAVSFVLERVWIWREMPRRLNDYDSISFLSHLPSTIYSVCN